MNKVPIKLKTKEDVEDFVSTCSHCPYDIDIIQGRLVIDAKSLLGLLTLDLSKETYVMPHDNEEAFFGLIEEFLEEEP